MYIVAEDDLISLRGHANLAWRRLFAALSTFVLWSGIPVLRAQAPPSTLKIEVIEGEGAINNIRQHRARAPVVRVLDDDSMPVSRASVTFSLPDMGPSGEFPGNVQTLAVLTDDKGQATGRGLTPNQVVGEYQIHVVASYRGQMATAIIHEVNAEPGGAATGAPSRKFWLIAVIGGAAIGGVALAATHGGGGASSPPSQPLASTSPIVITSGAPVFQPPH